MKVMYLLLSELIRSLLTYICTLCEGVTYTIHYVHVLCSCLLVILYAVLIDVTLDSDTSMLCSDSLVGVHLDLTLDDSCQPVVDVTLDTTCDSVSDITLQPQNSVRFTTDAISSTLNPQLHLSQSHHHPPSQTLFLSVANTSAIITSPLLNTTDHGDRFTSTCSLSPSSSTKTPMTETRNPTMPQSSPPNCMQPCLVSSILLCVLVIHVQALWKDGTC